VNRLDIAGGMRLFAENLTMHGHLTHFCHARDIPFTRSRSWHKNDNSHVEEKNNSVIRKFVGYDRHDIQGEINLLNRPY